MYLAVGVFLAAFLYLRDMLEFIGVVLVELVGVVVAEWLFGGIFKSLRWIGYRIFSLFNGEQDIPVSELGKKYDDSIWPWVIVAVLLGGGVAVVVLAL